MSSTALQKLFFIINLTDQVTKPLKKIEWHVDKFKQHAAFSFGLTQGIRSMLAPAIAFQGAVNKIGVVGAGSASNLNAMVESAQRMTTVLGTSSIQYIQLLHQTRRLSGLAGDALETMASGTGNTPTGVGKTHINW